MMKYVYMFNGFWLVLAAVAWGAGKEMVIEDVEVSPPQSSEIRIKIVSTSLCRSDVTAWQSQVLLPFSTLYILLIGSDIMLDCDRTRDVQNICIWTFKYPKIRSEIIHPNFWIRIWIRIAISVDISDILISKCLHFFYKIFLKKLK